MSPRSWRYNLGPGHQRTKYSYCLLSNQARPLQHLTIMQHTPSSIRGLIENVLINLSLREIIHLRPINRRINAVIKDSPVLLKLALYRKGCSKPRHLPCASSTDHRHISQALEAMIFEPTPILTHPNASWRWVRLSLPTGIKAWREGWDGHLLRPITDSISLSGGMMVGELFGKIDEIIKKRQDGGVNGSISVMVNDRLCLVTWGRTIGLGSRV